MSFDFENPLIAASALILFPLAALILWRLRNPFVAALPLGAPGGTPFKSSQIGILVK
jgi:hypothetical protein